MICHLAVTMDIWRLYDMATLNALMTLCEGNHWSPGRARNVKLYIFLVLDEKLLKKRASCWWCQPLWRLCAVTGLWTQSNNTTTPDCVLCVMIRDTTLLSKCLNGIREIIDPYSHGHRVVQLGRVRFTDKNVICNSETIWGLWKMTTVTSLDKIDHVTILAPCDVFQHCHISSWDSYIWLLGDWTGIDNSLWPSHLCIKLSALVKPSGAETRILWKNIYSILWVWLSCIVESPEPSAAVVLIV